VALTSILTAVERLGAFARALNTLPPPGQHRLVAGLVGSSDAALVAALSARLPDRFFVVAAETVPDAERWLADLQTLSGGEGVSLYPPREGFGEVEPHMEVAGERVETLERVNRGQVRILLTTVRALLERTRMPRALRDLRLELRKGDIHRPSDLVLHLESIGFERVEMVEDVAQFSVRGGILDIYGFGMADPVRAEFWGDEIVDLRHFELTSQRSTRAADVALVLPVDGQLTRDTESFERLPITALFPPDTLLVLPSGTHLEPRTPPR
jgi:transcription-repair coupling factor (superfamily II helicase)